MITNHQEALELAEIKQGESNLARAYLELSKASAPFTKEAHYIAECNLHPAYTVGNVPVKYWLKLVEISTPQPAKPLAERTLTESPHDWANQAAVDALVNVLFPSPGEHEAALAFVAQALCEAEQRGYQRADWQPIATAPKDGTHLVLWWPDGQRIKAIQGYYWRDHWFAEYAVSGAPTHWLPLREE